MEKPSMERVKTLLKDTITLLCKNGIEFKNKFNIEALIGVTVDDDQVHLMSINELIHSDNNQPAVSEGESDSATSARRKRKRKPRQTNHSASDSSDDESASKKPVPGFSMAVVKTENLQDGYEESWVDENSRSDSAGTQHVVRADDGTTFVVNQTAAEEDDWSAEADGWGTGGGGADYPGTSDPSGTDLGDGGPAGNFGALPEKTLAENSKFGRAQDSGPTQPNWPVPNPVRPSYKQWHPADMRRAMDAVLQGDWTMSAASKIFHIPMSTLKRRIAKEKGSGDGRTLYRRNQMAPKSITFREEPAVDVPSSTSSIV